MELASEERLTPRKQNILKIVIGEYIATAMPIGSEHITSRYGLGISPATIRNEMADLEREGYIIRPHTSAGGIPSDKGYRYYVECLLEEQELPPNEQRMIRHQFHQVEMELEEWTRLACTLLARLVRNVAIVTLPKANECRLKHLELIALQEFLALAILVLQEAKIKRQMLAFDEAISQNELEATANRFNVVYKGLTSSQIIAMEVELSPIEDRIARTIVHMMQAEDERGYQEMCLDGLRHFLSQPEFAASSRTKGIVEVLEERSLLNAIIPQVLTGEGVRVIIGGENREDAMRQCSMVLSRYGLSGEASGAIGVVGPTRMPYGRTIGTVRYLSSVMSELLRDLHDLG